MYVPAILSRRRRVCPETEATAAEILTLLGDEYVQRILVATHENPQSAKQISETLDAAQSTVYDRADAMVDHGLLVEHTRIMDDGSHHSAYESTVDHLDIDIDDDELAVHVERRETAAERFTKIWGDIREV